jgi:hypothetical protein
MRIVSGGQSGVDRAALDVAIALGLEYGGWVPQGGWAEDYDAPPGVLVRYPQLRETASADPAERTRLNVRDSDATLIIVHAASTGTALTEALARELARPHLAVRPEDPAALSATRVWLAAVAPATLNVAGPRESEAPGVYERACRLLRALLG